MASHYCNSVSRKLDRALFPRRARRGAVALEFAILAIPFFLWVMFIFELSYDLFTQEALDTALHVAVRQIQTGNADGATSGQDFINRYLCPATRGLLECDPQHMSISVTLFSPNENQPTPSSPAAFAPDYSFVTTGNIPTAPFPDGAGSLAFCTAQPKQLVLVQALYLGPSFVAGLMPGVLSGRYTIGGSTVTVHPTLSTAGFVVEPYTATSVTGAAPACS
jgi:hypothetical protein